MNLNFVSKKNSFINNTYIPYLFLFISWFAVQVFWFSYKGIQIVHDSQRFMNESLAWHNGHFEYSFKYWYSIYIAILTLVFLLTHSFLGVIFLQLLLSIFSLLYFYKALQTYTSVRYALIGVSFLILYLPIQQWNWYVLTESFYFSFLVLCCAAFLLNKRRLVLLCLFMVMGIRPTGFTLLLALLVAWYDGHAVSNQKKYFTLGLTIPVLLVLVYFMNTHTLAFVQFLKASFSLGEVICGSPLWSVNTTYSYTSKHYSLFYELYMIVVQYWQTFIPLFVLKILVLLTDVRPYYHWFHNVFILLFLIPFYSMLIYRFRIQTWNVIRLVAIVFVILNATIVGMTYVDWDGRFLVPLFPFLVLLLLPAKAKQ
jgi:hypothetical protein